MTRDTVRLMYLKHLEHNPSAAPKFHAWVDQTAPSPSPPLSEPSWAHVVPGSEPAPSSSRSSASAKKPCTASKPFYLTPVQREKVQLDKNKKDNALTKMVKKLTQELKHRQDTGAARASASQVLEDFKEVLAQQKISIGKSTLNKYVANGTINKPPKKRGRPSFKVPPVVMDATAGFAEIHDENGDPQTAGELASILMQVLETDPGAQLPRYDYLHKLMRSKLALLKGLRKSKRKFIDSGMG